MSANLRRCVVEGPIGLIGGNHWDYRVSRSYYIETNTPYVRLWADWPTLQPTSGTPLGTSPHWADLDAQVQAANADSKLVIITAFRYPGWSNGTSPGETEPGTGKDGTFKVPTDRSTTGPWAAFIEHLILRYSPYNPANRGIIIFLEICNEPNLQMWPLYSGSTRIMQCFLADMIMTAQQMKVKNGLGSSLPVLLAPATADTTSSTPARVPYSTFTDDLLNTLQGYNFHPGIWYGWSHHNYNDIELDQGSNSSTGRNTMYVADVRNRITSRSGWNGWAGWPTGRATDSAIVLTEGAARREVLYNTYWYDECYVAGHCEGTDEVGTWDWMNDKQARLLEKNWARLQNDGEGARVAMLSWYLFTSTVGGDSGLRDYDPPPWFQGYVDGDTQARPAYWKWQSFPTNY